MERVLRDHDIDVVVNFAAESHNSYAIAEPRRVLPHQRRRHADICARPPRRRRRSAAFHHISTCEVYGDLDLDTDELFTESSPLPAPLAVHRVEGRRRPAVARRTTRPSGCRSRSRNCTNNFGPYQFPEKVDPALHHASCSTTSRSRCTRRRRTSASGSTSTTTAAAIAARARRRARRARSYHIGTGNETPHRGDRRQAARAARQAARR